ncbi:DUF2523 family protein [Thalassomonas sp. RHCl1]|uniref:DUF2523 family protein n=1 Tax=Thalassomonas sp. RHCl1 TaxID=2995320 RepID=UPI00248CF449|nr:DUF2523 family protein [Thalassomonas sp. RHCl1]
MKKLFLFSLLLLPALVYANTQTYQDAAGTSQMLADSIGDFWTYLFTDTPNMLHRFAAWLLEYWVQLKLYVYLELMKFSWGVAKVIIEDLSIMSQITAQMSLLPIDVRQAFVDMRLFDGINLILNAYVTKFVMRLLP